MQIPNYTQVPNIILDNMHKLTPSEFMVFSAICRKTIGWHKLTDRISYSQLKEMTGLSINTLRKSLDGLINKEIISQEKTKFGYKYDIKFAISEIDIAKNDTSIPKIDTKPISKIDTTKDISKDTNNKDNKNPITKNTIKNKRLGKHQYGEYKNILLSDIEHKKLTEKFGDNIKYWIKTLDEGIALKGYKYKSHYLAILNWSRNDNGKKESSDIKYENRKKDSDQWFEDRKKKMEEIQSEVKR